jgi:hypothetical protein
MDFVVHIHGREGPLDRHDDNVDVEVILNDGERYTATFFTITNIQQLMARYRGTGECANGLYFWSSRMIIVNELTRDAIVATVANLFDTGEFESAFEKLNQLP